MKPGSAVDELVPLADRLRNLQVLRVLLAGAFAAYVTVAPDARPLSLPGIVSVIALYLVGSFTGHAVWHVAKARSITLFGALLVVDGFFLAWATWAAGGPAGPVRYLVVVHVTAIALLASYRTAVRIALWHSLLTIITLHAARAGMLVPTLRPSGSAGDYEHAAFFLAIVWIATLTTAAFAAVNERELRRRRVDLMLLARMARELQRATGPAEVENVLEQALIDAFGFSRVVVLRGAASAPRETLLLTELGPDLAAITGPMRNVVVAPMFAEGQAIGTVLAQTDLRGESRIARRVVTMVERFCDHAALALRNATLVDELRLTAATDGLTGVSNRRAFDEALSRELARGRRGGRPVSIALVDLDEFKALNDTHGHQTGDAVLRVVAGTLRTAGRVGDTVARYGGEEFVVILPDCPSDAAVEAGERLRTAVAECSPDVPVTASIGIATAYSDALDAVGLVAAADAALYEAKARGRNRVVTAAPIGSTPAPA